ncbi:MAG: hypothetical protein AAF721_33625 [Myxococcota bacterium]
MTIKSNTRDIPMAPGSDLIRGRVQHVQSVPSTPASHGEDSERWGDFSAESVFDNEDYDDPRHDMSLADLAAESPGIRVVRYQNQDPEQAEVMALVQSAMFASVEFLDFKRNFRSPSDADWAEIIASGHLSHLRFLGLDSCYGVADATLTAIASGAMPRLEALELGSTDVTDDGLVLLADATKTPSLGVVQGMFMGKLTERGIETLASKRPDLVLRFTL